MWCTSETCTPIDLQRWFRLWDILTECCWTNCIVNIYTHQKRVIRLVIFLLHTWHLLIWALQPWQAECPHRKTTSPRLVRQILQLAMSSSSSICRSCWSLFFCKISQLFRRASIRCCCSAWLDINSSITCCCCRCVVSNFLIRRRRCWSFDSCNDSISCCLSFRQVNNSLYSCCLSVCWRSVVGFFVAEK